MFRARRIAVSVAIGVLLAQLLAVPVAGAGGTKESQLSAYLDGRPIPLSDVGKYYCDDFDYPVIRCSSSPLIASLRTTTVTLLAAVDYVTIYENTSFNGAYMHVSQDYGSLITIGWNDRISSFRGRNSETGTLWTDWFNTGSSWPFCCNSQFSSLGAYNNTFSSVQRT